jgi:DnaJ-domain-containing protein 1
LNDDEKAECLSRIGCVSFATLRRLREQRERDSAYQVNRRLSEPRTNAPASAHVIFAVLDGGDAALALLGLDWGATPELVKAAYHKAALIHHPDKPGGDGARMADLSKAYTVALKYAERRGREAP